MCCSGTSQDSATFTVFSDHLVNKRFILAGVSRCKLKKLRNKESNTIYQIQLYHDGQINRHHNQKLVFQLQFGFSLCEFCPEDLFPPQNAQDLIFLNLLRCQAVVISKQLLEFHYYRLTLRQTWASLGIT